jgi:hypothetical protein
MRELLVDNIALEHVGKLESRINPKSERILLNM